jgi:hypothetical protein
LNGISVILIIQPIGHSDFHLGTRKTLISRSPFMRGRMAGIGLEVLASQEYQFDDQIVRTMFG